MNGNTIDGHYYMSGQELIGSMIFFYILLPSLIIMGIWTIVRSIRIDEEWRAGWQSFAQDYLRPSTQMDDLQARLREARHHE